MKIGPVVHGALTVLALGFAYQTWTKEKSEPPKAGEVTVWNESLGDFESFAYDAEAKSVRVEKRSRRGTTGTGTAVLQVAPRAVLRAVLPAR
jgi:hypothetical protein